MTKYPTTFTWRGKRREECTREDLLEIIDVLGKFWNERHTPEAINAYALGEIEMMKRWRPKASA